MEGHKEEKHPVILMREIMDVFKTRDDAKIIKENEFETIVSLKSGATISFRRDGHVLYAKINGTEYSYNLVEENTKDIIEKIDAIIG